MANDVPLMLSLQAVGAVMRDARDPWWIIASAAVALHGADAGPVADVDVLLSIADAGRILPTIGVAPREGATHDHFRSVILGRWDGTALPVEFMAGFDHRSNAGWRAVEPATRQAVAIGGERLFIPDRAELLEMLRAFGRPKDLERARRLAAPG